MDSTPTVSAPAADIGLRPRAKEQLYVACQLGGWSILLVTQLLFVRLFGMAHESGNPAYAVGQTLAEGLLITHCARHWIAKWGWKDLGWRALVPRILGMAAVLSAAWSASGYGIYYGLLRNPWPEKYHPLAILTVSLFNGTLLMAGWLCLYFF